MECLVGSAESTDNHRTNGLTATEIIMEIFNLGINETGKETCRAAADLFVQQIVRIIFSCTLEIYTLLVTYHCTIGCRYVTRQLRGLNRNCATDWIGKGGRLVGRPS